MFEGIRCQEMHFEYARKTDRRNESGQIDKREQ